MKYNAWFVLAFTFLLLSCNSNDVVVIPDNIPPPDGTISLLYRENFINKTYLGLLGVLPSEEKLAEGMVILDKNNCSQENRTELLNTLMASQEYRKFHFYTDFNELLDYPNQWDFGWIHDYIIERINDPNAATEVAIWQEHQQLMDTLTGLWNKYDTGEYDLRDCHVRMVNNLMYFFEIGSKSEWPEATFSYFLHRLPTEEERYGCLDMMSGLSKVLFLKEGSSMYDLRQIFFNSTEYFEGQVRTLFNRYLEREPIAEEIQAYVGMLSENPDLQAVQRKILLTNEFLIN